MNQDQPDIASQNPAGEPAAEPSLQQQLDSLHNEVALLRAESLRERADLDNQRKRVARDVEQARRFANEKLLGELQEYGQTNTQIILSLSEGPAETTAPPRETESQPEETEPKDVIMDVTFYLPHREAPYTLTIFCNGWQVTAARQIEAGVTEIKLEMSGSGTKRYDLYIDDVYYASQDVVFGQYG